MSHPLSGSDSNTSSQSSSSSDSDKQREVQHENPSKGLSNPTSNEAPKLTRTRSKNGLVTIGNYIVGQKIGEGTFGKVMLGRHKMTNQKVALKIIEIKSATVQRNIERESRLMKLLNHENIVRLYEVIDMPERNATCLVLEYVDGGELFDYIINKERLEEQESVRFFRQMLSAVEYCHANLVVHRDLKPENVLLDQNKNVKILDFGLANMMNLKDFLHTNCGSPIYCAPEILHAQQYIGPEVDVWALGVILYVMVTGCCPWSGRNLQEQIKKAQIGLYDNIDGIVSPECANLIGRILTVDAKKRPTIAEIWQHPWVLQGLHSPVQPITTQRKPATFIDNDIVKQMCDTWGFDKGEVINDILSNKSVKQSYVLYHLMLDAKKRQTRPTLNRKTSSSKFPTWSPETSRGEEEGERRGLGSVTLATSTDESATEGKKSEPTPVRLAMSSDVERDFKKPPTSPQKSPELATSPRKDSFFSNIFKKKPPSTPASPNADEKKAAHARRASLFIPTLEAEKEKEPKQKSKLHTVKGSFALDKVSHKTPEEIEVEIERVLNMMNIHLTKKRPYKYSCKLTNGLKMDLEICQIEKSDAKGIRMKRKSGSVWDYKEQAKRICAALNI